MCLFWSISCQFRHNRPATNSVPPLGFLAEQLFGQSPVRTVITLHQLSATLQCAANGELWSAISTSCPPKRCFTQIWQRAVKRTDAVTVNWKELWKADWAAVDAREAIFLERDSYSRFVTAIGCICIFARLSLPSSPFGKDHLGRMPESNQKRSCFFHECSHHRVRTCEACSSRQHT